ncbi:MAG: BatA domain-containing protein [Planctomycetaceae bacterium]|nr:BatA domain-containing protein [Planctomycetaceae bacterium]
MTFLNAAILFGLGLTAIPVILHLLLRNKPKKLPFPALRLLMLSKKSNTRRMKLKHLWLLLLRILLIAVIVLALARPTLPAADYGLTGGDYFRLAMIVVAAIAVERWFSHVWKNRSLSTSEFRSRQTTLRSLLGAVAFVLFLLLFLWPYGSRIVAQWKDPQSPIQENFPVSAVLLFDVSPSMEYREQNLTRLESAQELAQQLLSRLPTGSQLSVTHNGSTDPAVFLSDSTAARDRIDQLKIIQMSDTLDRRVQAAIDLQVRDRERILEEMGATADSAGNDRYLREIYIFTDLAVHQWRMSSSVALSNLMEENPWLAVYLVDVSAISSRNITLSHPQLSAETASNDSTLVIRAELFSSEINNDTQTVELFTRYGSGEMTKQGRQDVSLSEEGGAIVEFPLKAQRPGYLEGELRLVSSDPMLFDNQRAFTAKVTDASRVLVVSQDRDRRELFSTMLEKLRYQVSKQPPAALERLELPNFDIVCLLSAEKVSEASWARLEKFVSAGGGLFVSLGYKTLDPLSYRQSVAAKNVLPGLPAAFLKFTPPEFLDFGNNDHPLVAKAEGLLVPDGLVGAEVRWRWKVDVADDARVIVPFTNSDHSPALLERSLGRGRVLMLTTSIEPGDWNDLFFSGPAFFILSDLMLQALRPRDMLTYNFQVGESVVVPLPQDRDFSQYLFRTPGLQQTGGDLEPGAEQLSLGRLEQAGHYDVRSKPNGYRVAFSANLPEAESNLARLTSGELIDLFGEGRFGVARSLEELEPVVRSRRLGQEMVPLLILLATILFALEQVIANRFYDDDLTSAASPSSALKQAA